MSDCNVIQGYDQNCVSSTPGGRSLFLFTLPSGYTQTNIEEIVQLDGTDLDIVTDLSGATSGYGLDLYKFDFTKNTLDLNIEAVPDADGDISSYKATVAFNMKKMSAESRHKIQLLASNSKLGAIVADKNGVYHLVGIMEGGRLISANGMMGIDSSGKNGYELSLESTEAEYPHVVLADAIPPAIVG